MHPVFQKIIDLLLPPRCLKCGKILGTGGGLCPDCFNEITFIAKPYCSRCGNPLPAQARGREMLCGHCLADSRSPFRLSRSAVYYDEYSKPLILNFKFRDHTETHLCWHVGCGWAEKIFLLPVLTSLFRYRFTTPA